MGIIIGTAGHVDHGKTCLIKALTGIDTDRLKEEKKRGITIELGFAYLDLPSGQRAGIIDVPGHEKFIKNMLAGAGGIDIAMLIVAADEGMMPQTEEHLAILSLLDIKKGVVVLTKCDTVDEEWVSMMTEEVAEKIKGTFLENAPIVPVSAFSGQGIDRLRDILSDIAQHCEGKNQDIPFRVPVDRIFSVDGFGTVVTGTLIEGTATEGDSVTIYPGKLSAKIRGIQVHSQPAKQAFPGQRVAINLSGVHKNDLTRGDIIAAQDSMDTAMMVDVTLRVTGDTHRKIKNGSRLHFYHGSREILCKVVLLNEEQLEKNQTCYAQLRLEEAVSLKVGDHYIVRFYSPLETVGGGVVLDANPKKHKRHDEAVLTDMSAKETGTVQNKIALAIKEHSKEFMGIEDVKKRLAIDNTDFDKKIENLVKYNEILKITPRVYIHKEYVATVEGKCVTLLEKHHKEFPLQAGLKREEVASKLLKQADTVASNALLQIIAQGDKIKNVGGILSLKEFEIRATGEGEALLKKLEETYLLAGLAPADTEGILSQLPGKPQQVKEVYNALIKARRLVRLDSQITLHISCYEGALVCLKTHFESENQVTLAQFRDLIGTSRKYAVALLENFDNSGYTKKTGDFRIKNRL